MIPNVLSIAGSDPSGGAGVQADLKTFGALGAYGMAVLTALTAQSTVGVAAVHPVPAGFVAEQLDALFADVRVDAVKTGMLGSAAVVDAVAEALRRYRLPAVVVDPVMVSTSGSRLLDADAVDAVRERLLPLADLVTPNLAEAAVLLGSPTARTVAEMREQAEALSAVCGSRRVLLKGGHLDDAGRAVDVLAEGTRTVELTAPRVATANTHGTGCTLSSAVAARVAAGAGWADAVRAAKSYLTGALRAAAGLEVGRGAGPVDHFYRTRA
ncbi:bifunctional hydroxymethylpyrimidine kinase/phosphomethylpyrimidine kinase [Mangrovactinospora gilvigrisea]|uniref:Bifunctional hydroxymethylpyrimidine kinase/phosphomethylpyrimidine kinase n=1 Tax=Mangrovactinospora gilvigrisea TaxID=1428644 RepID=A0A1J7C6P0_9ACTN|nr:bifunctional hydroxymethylpyrimidine kinase/phosphomethylpyrimidine kinase [Mangrovactinospora gilvigrisea]OIV35306.1 bifunctional hydroxymethylpyrimidine kinase/phosphomethylpyrimidine kinase [Mangrovactinospora gilvigrisea]